MPPAHFLSASPNNVRAQRYWSAPTDGWIRYRRDEEYAEHFLQNLRLALADRMNVDSAGILLSGGMDSGALAAIAKEISPASNIGLKAYTVTYEKLLGDREGYFAQQTADSLNIPLEMIPMDDLARFSPRTNEDFVFPEPVDDPFALAIHEQFRAIAKHSRVVLYGEGIDNLMYFQLAPYLKQLARAGKWLALAGAFSGYCWRQRSRWHRLWHRALRRFGRKGSEMKVPRWISPDFARRVNLQERFACFALPKVSPAHPVLPVAHASLELPQWPRLFELSDAGFTQELVEVRCPFLDLRIVDYLLALPPFPLFLRKKLEREAMRGKLPKDILTRPKTPLGTAPCVATLRRAGYKPLRSIDWSEDIDRYISRKHVFEESEFQYSDYGNSCIRPICFNLWLQSSRRLRYNLSLEIRNA
ncbi:MAG: asparagine synthase-related protein [Candidatus Acidiferrales bacterium]